MINNLEKRNSKYGINISFILVNLVLSKEDQ